MGKRRINRRRRRQLGRGLAWEVGVEGRWRDGSGGDGVEEERCRRKKCRGGGAVEVGDGIGVRVGFGFAQEIGRAHV